jgi:hypothetical protein
MYHVRSYHFRYAERKFNEGAAQVKRLLKRDRSAVPDLDKPDSFSSENDAGEDLTANDPTPSSSVGKAVPPRVLNRKQCTKYGHYVLC